MKSSFAVVAIASILLTLVLRTEAQPVRLLAAKRPSGTISQSDRVLRVVRRYVEALLEHGRDRYGKVSSPLFAVTLDRQTLGLFEGDALHRLAKLKRDSWGIRSHDRMLTGANPMHDQNLYQILYALSAVSGDPRFRTDTDRTLAWFLTHCPSPVTGLLPWGEHMGWDFHRETIIRKKDGTWRSRVILMHEFFRPWVLWERCYRLAPGPCIRFAEGLWNHQIADHETGRFSRHARYDRHGPAVGYEFPRHGGFYIQTWSVAYAHTKNPVFVRAVRTLLGYYLKHRSPKTGGVPSSSSTPKFVSLVSNLSLAIDLWDAAPHMPASLAASMKKLAGKLDEVFWALPHDLRPGGRGFVTGAHIDTLELFKKKTKKKRTPLYKPWWAVGYSQRGQAQIASICMLRYRQTRSPKYRALILQTAEVYRTAEPDTRVPNYPGTMGDVIWLLVGAHELTGKAAHLDRARHFAELALGMFFDATSPLPKATSRHDHYEAITRADTLMMAFLRLWGASQRPPVDLELIYTDR